MHPAIARQIQDELKASKSPYSILVSPLLLETGQKDYCDKVLVVDVPVETQVERTLKRDGVSEEQVQSIIKAQISRQNRLELADEVIINDGSLEDLQLVVKQLHKKIITEVMMPTMEGLISEGSPYLGFLYAGLMIKDGELKVLEFNCRFGDPETQPILIRLQSSLVELCLAAINEDMDSYNISWTKKHACGVVIASEGYPESY